MTPQRFCLFVVYKDGLLKVSFDKRYRCIAQSTHLRRSCLWCEQEEKKIGFFFKYLNRSHGECIDFRTIDASKRDWRWWRSSRHAQYTAYIFLNHCRVSLVVVNCARFLNRNIFFCGVVFIIIIISSVKKHIGVNHLRVGRSLKSLVSDPLS